MDEFIIYKFMEFLIFSSYLLIIYLFTQIWFMWMDIDKTKSRSKILIDGSLLKNNIIIVFSMSLFFLVHEFFEGTNLINSYIYYEFFELLGVICIALFLYKWHSALKTFACKKPIHELLVEVCASRKIKVVTARSIFRMDRITKWILFLGFGFVSSILVLFIPVSTLYFTLMIGLLFFPPVIAVVSTLIGASILSNELSHKQAI